MIASVDEASLSEDELPAAPAAPADEDEPEPSPVKLSGRVKLTGTERQLLRESFPLPPDGKVSVTESQVNALLCGNADFSNMFRRLMEEKTSKGVCEADARKFVMKKIRSTVLSFSRTRS